MHTPYRGLTLTTAPAVEPVLGSEVNTFLGLSTSDDDTLLDALATAAREQCEAYTGRALITQTWTMTLDRLPGGREPWWDGVREMAVTELYGDPAPIFLPKFPVQSVTSVKLYDWADAATTVTASVYYVDTAQEPSRIVLERGQVWPAVSLRAANGVEVVFVGGYGDAAADVPDSLKQGIKMLAAYLYEHRGECDVKQAVHRSGAASLWNAYRVGRF